MKKIGRKLQNIFLKTYSIQIFYFIVPGFVSKANRNRSCKFELRFDIWQAYSRSRYEAGKNGGGCD